MEERPGLGLPPPPPPAAGLPAASVSVFPPINPPGIEHRGRAGRASRLPGRRSRSPSRSRSPERRRPTNADEEHVPPPPWVARSGSPPQGALAAAPARGGPGARRKASQVEEVEARMLAQAAAEAAATIARIDADDAAEREAGEARVRAAERLAEEERLRTEEEELSELMPSAQHSGKPTLLGVLHHRAGEGESAESTNGDPMDQPLFTGRRVSGIRVAEEVRQSLLKGDRRRSQRLGVTLEVAEVTVPPLPAVLGQRDSAAFRAAALDLTLGPVDRPAVVRRVAECLDVASAVRVSRVNRLWRRALPADWRKQRLRALEPNEHRGALWVHLQLQGREPDTAGYTQLLCDVDEGRHAELGPHRRDTMRFELLAMSGDEHRLTGRAAHLLFATLATFEDVAYHRALAAICLQAARRVRNEAAAYSMLREMLGGERLALRGLFARSTLHAEVRAFQLEALVAEHLPRLSAHLEVRGLDVHDVAGDWLRSLFACFCDISPQNKVDASDAVAAAWDWVMLDGWKGVHNVALGLLAELEDTILLCDSLGALQQRLRRVDQGALFVRAQARRRWFRIHSRDLAAQAAAFAEPFSTSVVLDGHDPRRSALRSARFGGDWRSLARAVAGEVVDAAVDAVERITGSTRAMVAFVEREFRPPVPRAAEPPSVVAVRHAALLLCAEATASAAGQVSAVSVLARRSPGDDSDYGSEDGEDEDEPAEDDDDTRSVSSATSSIPAVVLGEGRAAEHADARVAFKARSLAESAAGAALAVLRAVGEQAKDLLPVDVPGTIALVHASSDAADAAVGAALAALAPRALVRDVTVYSGADRVRRRSRVLSRTMAALHGGGGAHDPQRRRRSSFLPLLRQAFSSEAAGDGPVMPQPAVVAQLRELARDRRTAEAGWRSKAVRRRSSVLPAPAPLPPKPAAPVFNPSPVPLPLPAPAKPVPAPTTWPVDGTCTVAALARDAAWVPHACDGGHSCAHCAASLAAAQSLEAQAAEAQRAQKRFQVTHQAAKEEGPEPEEEDEAAQRRRVTSMLRSAMAGPRDRALAQLQPGTTGVFQSVQDAEGLRRDTRGVLVQVHEAAVKLRRVQNQIDDRNAAADADGARLARLFQLVKARRAAEARAAELRADVHSLHAEARELEDPFLEERLRDQLTAARLRLRPVREALAERQEHLRLAHTQRFQRQKELEADEERCRYQQSLQRAKVSELHRRQSVLRDFYAREHDRVRAELERDLRDRLLRIDEHDADLTIDNSSWYAELRAVGERKFLAMSLDIERHYASACQSVEEAIKAERRHILADSRQERTDLHNLEAELRQRLDDYLARVRREFTALHRSAVAYVQRRFNTPLDKPPPALEKCRQDTKRLLAKLREIEASRTAQSSDLQELLARQRRKWDTYRAQQMEDLRAMRRTAPTS